MKKAISILCAAALLFVSASARAFEAEPFDYTGEWVIVAVDEGDGILKEEYSGAIGEDLGVMQFKRDKTVSGISLGSSFTGNWAEIEGGIRVTAKGQPALDFLLKDGQLVVDNGAGDTFYLSRAEGEGASGTEEIAAEEAAAGAEEAAAGVEEAAAKAEGTTFVFSRNGITWAATPRQVREVEDVDDWKEFRVYHKYPDYQLLDTGDAVAAGVEAESLNYLFYKDSLLAIFYDFVCWESGNAEKRDSLTAAMTKKYGEPQPAENDWVTEHLKYVPEDVLTVLYMEDMGHTTWMIHEDTAAFIITYNQRSGFALVYVNRGLLAEMGFEAGGGTPPVVWTPSDGI